jgi:hypothetical protein
VAAFCLACMASFANATARSVAGDAKLVSIWPTLSHADEALQKQDDARLLFPSLRLEHSGGTALGFGECGIDAKNSRLTSATIWLRSDAAQTETSLPISSKKIPNHLEIIANGRPRLLSIRAEQSDLVLVVLE